MYQERDALRMVKFSSAEKALKGKSQVDFRSAYDSAQPAGRKHCFETNLAILHKWSKSKYGLIPIEVLSLILVIKLISHILLLARTYKSDSGINSTTGKS